MDRRTALTTSLGALALLSVPDAQAQTLPPGAQEKTVGKGVRVITYGESPSIIPGIKTVRFRDVILEPRATNGPSPMMPMICHMAQGELEVTRTGTNPDEKFLAKQYHVWTCSTGMTEGVENKGNTVAVMRIIDIIT
jgi:hypothetical protein